MKMTNKKGFTIVELVIVVAVIAILSAVLIPTVAGLVKKANLTSDQAAVKQMNDALASAEAAKEIGDAINVLEAAGYNAKDILKPVTKNHKFMWFKEFNAIVLVNVEDANAPKLVYPTDAKYADKFDAAIASNGTLLCDIEEGVEYIDVVASKPAEFIGAMTTGTKDVKINKDVTLDYATINTKAGAETVIDLGGKTLTTKLSGGSNQKHAYAFDVYGTVTIKNGTISARGVQVRNGGKLIIGEGVTIESVDTNGGACVWIYEGGELVIDGGNFNAPTAGPGLTSGATLVYNEGGKVTINGGTFKSTESYAYAITNEGTMTINGGKFEAHRGAICNYGTVTVNGGEFKVTGDWASGWAICCYEGKVTVNAGSFYTKCDRMFCATSTGEIVVKKGVVFGSIVLSKDLELKDVSLKLDGDGYVLVDKDGKVIGD